MTVKIGILDSFTDVARDNLIEACQELGVDHEVVDILSADWLDIVRSSNCDGYFPSPSDRYEEQNAVYMERVYFLNQEMGLPIYPSYRELRLYENKRNMDAWLDLHGLPHPPTRVFIKKDEALTFVKNTDYPLVFKANVGSSARGVSIVRSRREAVHIVHKIFGRISPNHAKGYIKPKPGRLIRATQSGRAQRHYVIIQDLMDVKWEWRLIRIGESYFGHQKLLRGQFASGSDLVGWVKPPDHLLRLAKEVFDRGEFRCMAMDVFETENGQFLINELQTVFGSYDDSQMYIDGTPGRFLEREGKFVFDEGVFNRCGSCLLRVEDFLRQLGKKP